jgi:hypothetical protein
MMTDEKSKKSLKLKTFDEIQNDGIYEIHVFPKKRRTQTNKSSVPTIPNEDESIDDQVRRSF